MPSLVIVHEVDRLAVLLESCDAVFTGSAMLVDFLLEACISTDDVA